MIIIITIIIVIKITIIIIIIFIITIIIIIIIIIILIIIVIIIIIIILIIIVINIIKRRQIKNLELIADAQHYSRKRKYNQINTINKKEQGPTCSIYLQDLALM